MFPLRGYKLKDKHGHILKTHFPSKQVKRYFHGIPTEEYDEDNVHECVDKSLVIQGKEAHKQLSITELLNPILQNLHKHHMETDMEWEVTHDPGTLKNELAEDKPPTKFGDQILGKVMHL